jgi:hypothetical protein
VDSAPGVARQRVVVGVFRAASRDGDFPALASPSSWSKSCSGHDRRGARGGVGGGRHTVFAFTIARHRIVAIEMHPVPGYRTGISR